MGDIADQMRDDAYSLDCEWCGELFAFCTCDVDMGQEAVDD